MTKMTKLAIKIEDTTLGQIDRLVGATPYSTRHSILLTSIRAGIALLEAAPERIGEFSKAPKPNGEADHG